MNGFGDADPEDAWDPDDPITELIDNLARRGAILADVAQRDDIHARAQLQIRLRLLADDLAHVAQRIAEGT